ncbi:hypothetical protein JQN64_26365, partial [Escherichia coli]|nr:hypothetical protein [Escherichia coli]
AMQCAVGGSCRYIGVATPSSHQVISDHLEPIASSGPSRHTHTDMIHQHYNTFSRLHHHEQHSPRAVGAGH